MSATPLEARRTRPGAALALAALLVIVAAAAGYDWLASRWVGHPRSLAPLATPPGITLQQRTDPKRMTPAAPPQQVYADEHGMTLYVRDRASGAATTECGDGCGKEWRRALAPSGATAEGDWSLRAHPDGSRQWEYRGAPLYRFDKDAAIGDALGDGADSGAWHAAVFDVAPGVATPGDISVHEIADAGGLGLVDAEGMTLYRYVGGGYAESGCESSAACQLHWRPLAAPAIASRVGEFSVIARPDGISQWAYRDRALYRFDGDQKSGDANGAGVDSRFDAALIVRHFMPAGVTIRGGTELGRILETSAGAPLYQRDRLDPNESHDPRGDRGPPALGRAYGTATCEADCTQQRLPLLAPADALPSGYWDVLARPEGTRQWAYKGFALYTYAGDVPGELRGNEAYELAQVGDDAAAALAATGKRTAHAPVAGVDPRLPSGASVAGVGLSALFWHVVVP